MLMLLFKKRTTLQDFILVISNYAGKTVNEATTVREDIIMMVFGPTRRNLTSPCNDEQFHRSPKCT